MSQGQLVGLAVLIAVVMLVVATHANEGHQQMVYGFSFRWRKALRENAHHAVPTMSMWTMATLTASSSSMIRDAK